MDGVSMQWHPPRRSALLFRHSAVGKGRNAIRAFPFSPGNDGSLEVFKRILAYN